jgi:hypothetical protein
MKPYRIVTSVSNSLRDCQISHDETISLCSISICHDNGFKSTEYCHKHIEEGIDLGRNLCGFGALE